MKDDAAIAEVRSVRKKISEECGHDPRQLVAHYRKSQRRYGKRVMEGRLQKAL